MIFFSRKKQEPMPPAPLPESDGPILLTDDTASVEADIVMPPPPATISAGKQTATESHVEGGNEESSDDLDKLNSEIESLEKEIKETEGNISRIDKELGKLGKKSK